MLGRINTAGNPKIPLFSRGLAGLAYFGFGIADQQLGPLHRPGGRRTPASFLYPRVARKTPPTTTARAPLGRLPIRKTCSTHSAPSGREFPANSIAVSLDPGSAEGWRDRVDFLIKSQCLWIHQSLHSDSVAGPPTYVRHRHNWWQYHEENARSDGTGRNALQSHRGRQHDQNLSRRHTHRTSFGKYFIHCEVVSGFDCR